MSSANNPQNSIEPLIQAELDEHPELNGQGDNSRNGSTAPTTNTGTPIPSAPVGRIKLNLSKPRVANGGSSGVQSDDDDDE